MKKLRTAILAAMVTIVTATVVMGTVSVLHQVHAASCSQQSTAQEFTFNCSNYKSFEHGSTDNYNLHIHK